MKKRSLLSLSGLLLVLFLTSSCSILDEAKNALSEVKDQLTSGLLSGAGLQFMDSGEMPDGNYEIITGVQFIAANGNSYATLIFTSTEELSYLYLQVAGQSGYYEKSLSQSDIANVGGGFYSYSVELDFAPELDFNNQKILVSGKSRSSGKVSETKESRPSVIKQYACNGNDEVSGDEAGFVGSFNMGKSSGSFKFNFNTYSVPDDITIYSGTNTRGVELYHFPSGGVVNKTEMISLRGEPTITIKVVGDPGTAWDFRVYCP